MFIFCSNRIPCDSLWNYLILFWYWRWIVFGCKGASMGKLLWKIVGHQYVEICREIQRCVNICRYMWIPKKIGVWGRRLGQGGVQAWLWNLSECGSTKWWRVTLSGCKEIGVFKQWQWQAWSNMWLYKMVGWPREGTVKLFTFVKSSAEDMKKAPLGCVRYFMVFHISPAAPKKHFKTNKI